MNLAHLKRHQVFQNPTPDERRATINSIKWWLFDKWGYGPHLDQVDGHLSDARFKIIIAGTRGGKSKLAGEEISVYLFAGAVRVWIVGQNYSLCEKEFRYVYERMNSPEVIGMLGFHPLDPSYGGRCIYNPDQGNMRLKTVWGAEVICISLERPGGAFGEEVDLICMSECAQIKKPKTLYEQVLFGRLSSRNGDVLIPTTPAGKSSSRDKEGWLYEMYQFGYDTSKPEYFTKEWPSWANPTFTEDPYWLRSWMNPLIFAEQYGGKFIVMSGTVFDNFNPDVHIIPPFEPPGHWNRYEAIDPGFTGKFVWLSSVMSENGILYINDEYADSEQLFETRAAAIKERRALQYNIHPALWRTFERKYNPRTILYIDNEDPQCMAELAKLGLPNVGANKKDILISIDRVQRRLKYANTVSPKIFITANCVDTIEAVQHHGWGEKNSSQVRKPANDAYKHWGDTIRYICGGTLVASQPFVPVQEVGDNTYWRMMEGMTSIGGAHPFDLTHRERRGAA